MNKYFRKFKKNAKALSPVVASIILIAVTVAVSVVVAAWMGGMTIGLMGNAEQASIANIAFTQLIPDRRTGAKLWQYNCKHHTGICQWSCCNYDDPTSLSVGKSAADTITLTLPDDGYIKCRHLIPIKLITAKGTQIQNSAVYNP